MLFYLFTQPQVDDAGGTVVMIFSGKKAWNRTQERLESRTKEFLVSKRHNVNRRERPAHHSEKKTTIKKSFTVGERCHQKEFKLKYGFLLSHNSDESCKKFTNSLSQPGGSSVKWAQAINSGKGLLLQAC